MLQAARDQAGSAEAFSVYVRRCAITGAASILGESSCDRSGHGSPPRNS
jgi:hypothetical protein